MTPGCKNQPRAPANRPDLQLPPPHFLPPEVLYKLPRPRGPPQAAADHIHDKVLPEAIFEACCHGQFVCDVFKLISRPWPSESSLGSLRVVCLSQDSIACLGQLGSVLLAISHSGCSNWTCAVRQRQRIITLSSVKFYHIRDMDHMEYICKL